MQMQDSTLPAPGNRPALLTLAIDGTSFEKFDGLRKRYFPPERNFLPAHITLFHKLPQARLAEITEFLETVASETTAFNMTVDDLWMLGGGVAYTLKSPEALSLRARLADQWREMVINQDRLFKPHITVQNKVAGETAQALYEELRAQFTPFEITAVGFDLWRYDGGPWHKLRAFHFS